jgi:hypothetical protein
LLISKYPNITFTVSSRRVPTTTKAWLTQRKEYLSKIWAKKGKQLLRSIEKNCGASFPNKAKKEGITVRLHKRRNDDPLGDMSETEPLTLNVYLLKNDTWRAMKGTIVHELIHCLMWQKYYFDERTSAPTLFADIFADELITSVVEVLVTHKKIGKGTCKHALTYAAEDAARRLTDYECESSAIGSLIWFFEEYRKRISQGSTILKERQDILKYIPASKPRTSNT